MTLRLLRRDESGLALGLALIVVVLIGVLAAGLLALLRNDLEATISANQGQRALALADAGAQAGMAQLRRDADPEHYDANVAENVAWNSGKTLTLGGDRASATVRYLIPATEADVANGDQPNEARYAPEPLPAGATDYPNEDFFAVVSEATSGETRRKVEVIVRVERSGDAHEVQQWSWREAYE